MPDPTSSGRGLSCACGRTPTREGESRTPDGAVHRYSVCTPAPIGAGRTHSPETVVCSYTVTHGLTCCWHADERPSTWVVTLGDDWGRCEHYVCDECAYAAAKGALPEQHADQDFIAMRVRR